MCDYARVINFRIIIIIIISIQDLTKWIVTQHNSYIKNMLNIRFA